MQEEIAAFVQNNTWDLVPQEEHMNVVGSKWVFKTKLKIDGSLDRLKARLVAKGYSQVEGLDFGKTFSPIIKPKSIRLILTITTLNH